jgi:hypothetical protein
MSQEIWSGISTTKITPTIFVFGSNEAGRHGKGAALHAKRKCGAIPGQAFGRQGNSFAIPTKNARLNPLPLYRIERYVMGFLTYAKDNPSLQFQLTPIGCGLAGYMPFEIAPMFVSAPSNVQLPQEFKEVLNG